MTSVNVSMSKETVTFFFNNIKQKNQVKVLELSNILVSDVSDSSQCSHLSGTNP